MTDSPRKANNAAAPLVYTIVRRELERVFGPDNVDAFEDEPLRLGVVLADGSFVNVRVSRD